MQVDRTLIRELAELLAETDLSEIEVADGDRRIRVARQVAVAAAAPAAIAAPAPAPVIAAPVAAPAIEAPAATDMAKHPGVVTSPMVGTCYTSPEPGAAAFVSVGSAVKEGQTLFIIEAMKVMNPIPAPRGGVVKHVFVNNEQPVEFGEPLVVIE
jgi:acetyl-CoA carboxylase biotin carboxyl carrier protein